MNAKTVRIYYFAHSKNAASTRYRGTLLLKEVKRIASIDHLYFRPSITDKIKMLPLLIKSFRKRNKEDIFIFQKMSQQNSNYVRMLKMLCRNVEYSIYDVDDAVYKIMGRDRDTINYFARSCKLVTVGSEALNAYFKNIGNKVVVIPTPVFHSNVVKQRKNKSFNIGWIGYYDVHRANLTNIITPVLKKLDFNFVFTILGVQNDKEEREISDLFEENLDTINLEIPRNINWGDEIEIAERLYKFDVGLSPMLPNEFNECKSAFKLKQYHSCGVPVLASPIGENIKYIEEGVNGFLCDTKDDWLKGILFYRNLSEEKYREVIAHCRESYIKSDYTINEVARAFLKSIFEMPKKYNS